MQIIRRTTTKAKFVPMDADEQTLYNIFTLAFPRPEFESMTIPTAVSFGDVVQSQGEVEVDFEASDDGLSMVASESKVQAEQVLLKLLSKLDDREKTIMLFQIARSAGYDITHEECAKSMGISREKYMVLLKKIKVRSAKILQITS